MVLAPALRDTFVAQLAAEQQRAVRARLLSDLAPFIEGDSLIAEAVAQRAVKDREQSIRLKALTLLREKCPKTDLLITTSSAGLASSPTPEYAVVALDALLEASDESPLARQELANHVGYSPNREIAERVHERVLELLGSGDDEVAGRVQDLLVKGNAAQRQAASSLLTTAAAAHPVATVTRSDEDGSEQGDALRVISDEHDLRHALELIADLRASLKYLEDAGVLPELLLREVEHGLRATDRLERLLRATYASQRDLQKGHQDGVAWYQRLGRITTGVVVAGSVFLGYATDGPEVVQAVRDALGTTDAVLEQLDDEVAPMLGVEVGPTPVANDED